MILKSSVKAEDLSQTMLHVHMHVFNFDCHILVIVAYTKLLEETNQTYWLDFGTLSGAHRCNDVLPHDGKFKFLFSVYIFMRLCILTCYKDKIQFQVFISNLQAMPIFQG